MHNPDIKQNPHPKARYQITLTINDAPGQFDAAQIKVRYKVENDACVPLQPNSGARLSPEKEISIPVEHIAGNVYRGFLYADALQDEDYFGLGVCHWEINIVNFSLSHGQTMFHSFASAKDVPNQQASSRYFLRSGYLSAKPSDSPSENIASKPTYVDAVSLEDATHQPGGYFETSMSFKDAFR